MATAWPRHRVENALDDLAFDFVRQRFEISEGGDLARRVVHDPSLAYGFGSTPPVTDLRMVSAFMAMVDAQGIDWRWPRGGAELQSSARCGTSGRNTPLPFRSAARVRTVVHALVRTSITASVLNTQTPACTDCVVANCCSEITVDGVEIPVRHTKWRAAHGEEAPLALRGLTRSLVGGIRRLGLADAYDVKQVLLGVLQFTDSGPHHAKLGTDDLEHCLRRWALGSRLQDER